MKAIGLTGGAFYGHFASKDALFAAIVEREQLHCATARDAGTVQLAHGHARSGDGRIPNLAVCALKRRHQGDFDDRPRSGQAAGNAGSCPQADGKLQRKALRITGRRTQDVPRM